MSNILTAGEKQKFIAKAKKVSEQKGQLEYEVQVNLALQKEIYEALYKEKAKEVEIKGFRKGKAPRELVEPQIYNELREELINFLMNYAIAELINEHIKDYIVLGKPVIVEYKLPVVETPLTFRVRFYVAKEVKLPDISKYKKIVKEPEIEVSEKEIEDTIVHIFEDWKKKSKAGSKFEKPEDAWVKELRIPGVNTLADLRKRLKEDIKHAKLHDFESKALQQVLEKVLEDLKVELPKEFLENAADDKFKQEEEAIKKYGISMGQYLEYYKKTVEDRKKEILEEIERSTKEELFWALYIKQYNIEVNPRDARDQVYLNYAVTALRIPPDAQLNSVILGEILRVARMYKALEDLKNRLGFHVHKHESEESTAVQNVEKDQDKKQEYKDSNNSKDSSETKKILIPGRDN